MKKELKMYHIPKVAKSFSVQEQLNPSHINTSEIIDKIITKEIKKQKDPLHIADLGAGANPIFYPRLFKRLLKKKGRLDWVEISPIMIKLAKEQLKRPKFKKRRKIIKILNLDIFQYLKKLPDNSLDAAIFKYTLDYIKNPERLFRILSKKLKKGGKIIATITKLDPILKNRSRSAVYLYKGKKIPKGKTVKLKEGDKFTIQFLKNPGTSSLEPLTGASTSKYYYSIKTLKKLAKKSDFKPKLYKKKNEKILILRK